MSPFQGLVLSYHVNATILSALRAWISKNDEYLNMKIR
jgi:hypothetical protein